MNLSTCSWPVRALIWLIVVCCCGLMVVGSVTPLRWAMALSSSFALLWSSAIICAMSLMDLSAFEPRMSCALWTSKSPPLAASVMKVRSTSATVPLGETGGVVDGVLGGGAGLFIVLSRGGVCDGGGVVAGGGVVVRGGGVVVFDGGFVVVVLLRSLGFSQPVARNT